MSELLHHLITQSAERHPGRVAVIHKGSHWNYRQLQQTVEFFARGLMNLGLSRGGRVAVSLPKQLETVGSLFGACMAGGVMVPVNPALKPSQVAHIINNCDSEFLVTSFQRWQSLSTELSGCPSLKRIILVDQPSTGITVDSTCILWRDLPQDPVNYYRRINRDIAALLYTSGSTGSPKGVVLSHTNLIEGAKSVTQYLNNHKDDRLLAILPLSFDYGFNQLTCAFLSGASVVLMDYLLPRDVIKAVEHYQITGLAAVPPLWVQLAELEWPQATDSLRYFSNSGGALPTTTLATLRQKLPQAQPYLMYGLTEAFRSTFLEPSEIDLRPTSIGKAIPNAEVLVLREDGSLCEANEPGELVHRGVHVSLGYWNDHERTAERFRPLPAHLLSTQSTGHHTAHPEIAVYSGDTVKKDEEGYLYFIGRKDDMIKSSGYRISPSELEEQLYQHPGVAEVAAFGIQHSQLGQAILLAIKKAHPELDEEMVAHFCKQHLPSFMQPKKVLFVENLPRNANGKIDRQGLSEQYAKMLDGH